MKSGRTGHWTKMHQSLAKFSEPEASDRTPFLADFATATPELEFSIHTGRAVREIRMLRATWRGLETWHGRAACRRASPRPYLWEPGAGDRLRRPGGRLATAVPTVTIGGPRRRYRSV